jgi:hypothetical protein
MKLCRLPSDCWILNAPTHEYTGTAALRAARTPMRTPARTWFGFGMKQATMYSDETPK